MPKHGEIIKDEIICERCNKTFTWVYKYRDPKQDTWVILDNVKDGETIVSEYDPNTRLAKVYCPHKGIRNEVCGQPKRFELDLI